MYRKVSTGLPLASEAARKDFDCLGKRKPLPSIPIVASESSQPPAVTRKPEKVPDSRSPPKRGVPPALRAPGLSDIAVPDVTRGFGRWASLIHRKRYSALAHTRGWHRSDGMSNIVESSATGSVQSERPDTAGAGQISTDPAGTGGPWATA